MTFCILVMMVLPMVVSAAPMTSNPNAMPKAFSTGAHGANEVYPGISPITGLAWEGDYRPFVVQISNSEEARPHLNLSEADIVYEAIYWGPAHTRYTAVYSDNKPELVGYLRSLRIQHMEIRQEWDAPMVAWGAQTAKGDGMKGTDVYKDFIVQNNVPSEFVFDPANKKGNPAIYKVTNRVAPHNAVANLAELYQTSWPKKNDGTEYVPRSHAYKFSPNPMAGNADTAVEIHIPYEEKRYYPHYTFNEQTRLYERWYCGEEQIDGESGKRIVAANVIVQFAQLTYYHNTASRPLTTMTGGGVMDAFIDGKHIRGTWERKGMNDRTVFLDASGQEITLMPGKTFIQIVPNSFSYTYLHAGGEEVTLDFGAKVAIATFDETNSDAEIDKVEENEGAVE